MEYNGKALADLHRSRRTRPRCSRKAGEQLAGFASCATTAARRRGCWIFAGAWTQAGNQMARRDNTDPSGIGQTLELGLGLAGEPAHPLQPRLVRPDRQAVGPDAQAVAWNGKAWGGTDMPDFKADEPPEATA